MLQLNFKHHNDICFVCGFYTKKCKTFYTSNLKRQENVNFFFMIFHIYSVRHEVDLDQEFL
jgi:hypothetical protein